MYATSIAKTWSYVSEVSYEGGPVKCVVNSCIVPFIIDDSFFTIDGHMHVKALSILG